MNKAVSRFAAILAMSALSVTVAIAAPGDKGKKEKAAAPHCPACKMELSSKKDKTHTAAVKIGKKTYYCCSACPMNKKAPPKTHKK